MKPFIRGYISNTPPYHPVSQSLQKLITDVYTKTSIIGLEKQQLLILIQMIVSYHHDNLLLIGR